MGWFNKLLASTLLTAAMPFTSATQAMEVRQYDAMAPQDQKEYINLLIKGAEQTLIGSGRADQAAEVAHLFADVVPGSTHALGMAEFESNLAVVRVADANNVLKNPNTARFHVEHAMKLTLQKNGIVLPPSFMTIASNFHPKFPLRTQPVTNNPTLAPTVLGGK